jgi:hypothetical protein
MNLDTIRRRLDFERRTLAPEGCVLETLPHISRIRCGEPPRHMISFSALTADNAESVIADQTAHYRSRAAKVEWKLYAHDLPADLLQRLGRGGFAAGPREAVLVLDLNAAPDWHAEPPRHTVIRVESTEALDLYRDAAEEIFGETQESTVRELRSALDRGSTRHRAYIVMMGHVAVAVGRLYAEARSAFGGLYGGGTRDRFRGRGLYRAIVATRARDARSSGARYLIVDALPTSRPILEMLGFIHLTDTWPCTLQATAI